MAEENTQDTRSPQPPRRGARPFVGPAGAAGQPLPLLRVTPMPRPAPFVRGPLPRPTLGTASRPAPTPSALPVAAEGGAVAEKPTAAAPEVTASAVDPTGLGLDALVAWSGAGVDAPDSAAAPASPANASAPAPDPLTDESPPDPVHAARYDQFAALDATWHEAAIEVPEPPAAPPSPTDGGSLGGVDEVSIPPVSTTADDATSGTPAPGPAWLMDDREVPSAAETQFVNDQALLAEASLPVEPQEATPIDAVPPDTTTTLPGDEGSWADVSIMMSADSIMAAEIEGEDALQSTAGDLADDALSAGDWPDPLLAEYAVYMPTPAIPTPAIATEPAEEAPADLDADAVGASTEVAAVASPTDEDVEDTASPMGLIAAWTSDGADADAASETHKARVAAALDRLAEQVRHGEIDVSSVVPGGPDAAVLAAVLAALLGGGRSSSR